MFYVPEEFINDENFYSYNGVNQTLTIYSNCENNHCTCTDLYTSFDYLKSEDYVCSMNDIHLLSSTPTSLNYYRTDYYISCILFIIMCFIIIYIPFRIVLRFFKITI